MDRYVTTVEAAETLSVSKRMIQKLIANGHLIACKVGRCVRVSEASMEAYAQQNRICPAAGPTAPRTKYRPGDKLV